MNRGQAKSSTNWFRSSSSVRLKSYLGEVVVVVVVVVVARRGR